MRSDANCNRCPRDFRDSIWVVSERITLLVLTARQGTRLGCQIGDSDIDAYHHDSHRDYVMKYIAAVLALSIVMISGTVSA